MEKNNSKRILLINDKDINYGTGYSFYYLLDRYNVKYVDQILDDDKMSKVLLHCRKEDTRKKLMAFISLMKFKYQNVLMPEDILLNEKLVRDKNRKNNFKEIFLNLGFDDKQCLTLFETLPFNTEKELIEIFIDYISGGFFNNLENKKTRRSNKEFLTIERIMRLYVDSYTKTNELEFGNNNELSELLTLKNSLEKLVETKNTAEREINFLREKIQILQNNRDAAQKDINALKNLISEKEIKSGGRK